MLQSMTGFGKSVTTTSKESYVINVRSLNSKNLDVNLNLPKSLRDVEGSIRKKIAKKLKRGKVDCLIQKQNGEEDKGPDVENIQNVMKHLATIDESIDTSTLFKVAMSQSHLWANDVEDMSDEDLDLIYKGLDEALDNLVKFREDEGKTLAEDLRMRVSKINSKLKNIDPFVPERTEKVKVRLTEALKDIQDYNPERLEQELVYYIEKMDVTEEQVRLKSHCDYFLEILALPESNGKKLNFIAQEMGREINTLGAKANHLEIQKVVVEMKDELEKIKEQILNVR